MPGKLAKYYWPCNHHKASEVNVSVITTNVSCGYDCHLTSASHLQGLSHKLLQPLTFNTPQKTPPQPPCTPRASLAAVPLEIPAPRPPRTEGPWHQGTLRAEGPQPCRPPGLWWTRPLGASCRRLTRGGMRLAYIPALALCVSGPPAGFQQLGTSQEEVITQGKM